MHGSTKSLSRWSLIEPAPLASSDNFSTPPYFHHFYSLSTRELFKLLYSTEIAPCVDAADRTNHEHL
jgi:hypothetical protein